ncbi:MAG: HPr family phosphocarrier protein [Marinicaulis sp.]|nr:HPr family phosphocarrier protein [Marinicaulis sp.]
MAGADTGAISAIVSIQNKLGLHIRPSRYLSALAKSWDAQVTVRNGDREASADSQLDLLMLVASEGTELTISATGPQAKEAVDSIVKMIEDKFGEES